MANHEQDGDADLNELENLLHQNEASVARIRAMIKDLKQRIEAEKKPGGGSAGGE